jgi:hypothetical protein
VTNAIYLSVGRVQYAGDQLSAKTFRHTERWSRMSEELPLHRVCDLALWIALTLFSQTSDIHVEPGTFYQQDQGFTVKNLADGPDYHARQLRAVVETFLSGRGQEDSNFEIGNTRPLWRRWGS